MKIICFIKVPALHIAVAAGEHKIQLLVLAQSLFLHDRSLNTSSVRDQPVCPPLQLYLPLVSLNPAYLGPR